MHALVISSSLPIQNPVESPLISSVSDPNNKSLAELSQRLNTIKCATLLLFHMCYPLVVPYVLPSCYSIHATPLSFHVFLNLDK